MGCREGREKPGATRNMIDVIFIADGSDSFVDVWIRLNFALESGFRLL
jgi:hypothetical protein